MKLALKSSIFLLVFFATVDESFSLSDYQIKRFCKKEERKLSCIKNLREKRSTLQKGDIIEIPAIPYKR